MSLVMKFSNTLLEEKRSLSKKKIQKEKHKNQYSNQWKLLSQDTSTQYQEKPLFSFVLMPSKLQTIRILKFQSDIQVPVTQIEDQNLGDLDIDAFSFNYRIIRMDKWENTLSFTLQPYERFISTIDVIDRIFGSQAPYIAMNFRKYHERYNMISQTKLSTQQEIDEFEANIQCAFDCRLQKIVDYQCITVARTMNQKYLDLLGINQEMLYDYMQETQCLPSLIFFDGNDTEFLQLNRCLEQLRYIQDFRPELKNYQGQIFQGKVTVKSFFLFDEEDKCFYDVMYWLYDCDEKWMNKNNVKKNYCEYFNLKYEPSYQSNKNCGYKEY
ncbi:hypothetical protein pb186bvf_014594 [Paramecium bursaria]